MNRTSRVPTLTSNSNDNNATSIMILLLMIMLMTSVVYTFVENYYLSTKKRIY